MPYQPLTLNFPPQVTILSNRTCTIGGFTQTIQVSNNSITITSTINISTVSIVCNNIQNPSSAISTSFFFYNNTNDGSVALSNFSPVQFRGGTLASCPWSFTLCTEQSNSDLSITFRTINIIPSGTNYFLIGYATSTWPNHRTKGLITTGVSLTCTYTLNGSTPFNASSCSASSLTIEVQFSAGSTIGAGTSVVVTVSGVTSPPTMQTATSQDYYVYTADSSKIYIDGATSCAISNVCVSNQTSATFTNTTMIVNGNYGSPDLKFTAIPFVITIQQLDTIEVSYSPLSSLNSCGTLKMYRSGGVYIMSNATNGAGSLIFTMPSGSGFNTDFFFPISLYLECTAFRMPPSETPVLFTFNFRRNSDLYLRLSTPVNAMATSFNSSRGRINQSSTAMTASNSATFNFLLGQ
jgi:hypothetical protein